MENLVSYRHTHQVLITLKKGAHLLKYGRKGKPKFCPFRLSSDESSLIWISSSGKRSLKLASVSRIIPGQRTAVFKRYLRPDRDYLSFSLIYDNGKRSLDLICKDKAEAEAWIAGLKALLSSGEGGRSKIDGWRDGGYYLEDNQDVTSNSQSDSSASTTVDLSSNEVSVRSSTNSSSTQSCQTENPMQVERLLVPWDLANMQPKATSFDNFRASTSSHGSSPDDDAIGDVYIWGNVICDKNTKADVLVPSPLESNLVLDVHVIACGARHAAIVTRQGEVFTWGEESGGHLDHGVAGDATRLKLVESLAFSSVDFVACGEFHTCAVTPAGELYIWGDGTHNASYMSHWTPKRVAGPLEGLRVANIACGPWHTALVTSAGRLYTYGDGTFGVLGHGDRESVSSPREVASLSGLRTIAVTCGVWHTAAIVGVVVTASSASVSSGKLFTWGDGDKNRLGHGDREPRLEPTCVSTLIEYDFIKIACGHSLTVGLTSSGQVFTMGSPVYGQLGDPECDGKAPCLVQNKLKGECVEEIACGTYHVAVLTIRNEVYTWGKGANGRLGHGDTEDRKTPTLVEALSDRYVRFIACGSNYSAAICVHKWVSGDGHSQCSACRLPFGFTRKRHNCYNCGLVHCHSCSSRKALRAALSPNPNKPYRVCDLCFSKLRNVTPRVSGENKDRIDRFDLKSSKLGVSSNIVLVKQLHSKADKKGRKGDDMKPVYTESAVNSRSVSPFSRKSSPPRSATPVPTTTGLSFSKGIMDGLRKTNELMNQEVPRLRAQVESLRQRCEIQEVEIKKWANKAQESMELAEEESTKSRTAKEVIKSLTAQLKDMSEKLPPGAYDASTIRPCYLSKSVETNGFHYDPMDTLRFSSSRVEATTLSAAQSFDKVSLDILSSNGTGHRDAGLVNGGDVANRVEARTDSRNSALAGDGNQVEAEWIDQYELGVYITLVALKDGTRDLKRVRFSRRRFGEHQAETWWSENREKVYKRYNVRGSDKLPGSGQNNRRSEGGLSPSSQL